MDSTMSTTVASTRFDSPQTFYAVGVLLAARHFVMFNPDWYDRPLELAKRSIGWPYYLIKGAMDIFAHPDIPEGFDGDQ